MGLGTITAGEHEFQITRLALRYGGLVIWAEGTRTVLGADGGGPVTVYGEDGWGWPCTSELNLSSAGERVLAVLSVPLGRLPLAPRAVPPALCPSRAGCRAAGK